MSKFAIDAIFRAHDRITAPLGRIKPKVASFGKGLERSLAVPTKLAGASIDAIKKIGLAAGVVAGALALPSRSILKTGADFEEAITAVGAVGLQTRDQIADLEQEALRLGATTSFTATQAANAMEIMARAGFSNQEVLAGVGGVLSAAAASGLEMAEVANHVSNVLKGMGLEASEAGRVADVLTLASSRTNSSIGSLGESMKNLSPVAKQFGIGLEDAVGMVALLQDVGLDASEAGTATATMMTKLAKPTASVEKQMKKLGITFKNAEGNMLPPLEIFAQMQEANKKLGGNMDQVAFFADLVGLRGQKAALNLKDLFTSDKGQKLTEELRSAAGSAEKMAALRTDNLLGDWELLKSAADGVKVAIFGIEGEGLRGVVQGMTDWVNANKDLIVDKVKAFLGYAKDIAKVFGSSFMETISTIKEAFGATFDEKNTGALQSWAKELIPSLAHNLGQIAGFTVATVGGLVALTGGIVAVGNAIFGGLKGAFDGYVSFVGDKIFGIVDWFANIEAIFKAEGMSLKDKAIAIGKQLIQGYVDGVISMARAPVDAILKIGGSTLQGLKDSLGIKSPSREMMKLGRYTGDGLAIGLDKVIPRLEIAARDLGQTVLAGLAPATTALHDAMVRDTGDATLQLVSPQTRANADLVERMESREISESRVTIEDRTGTARIDRPSPGITFQQVPSGAL